MQILYYNYVKNSKFLNAITESTFVDYFDKYLGSHNLPFLSLHVFVSVVSYSLVAFGFATFRHLVTSAVSYNFQLLMYVCTFLFVCGLLSQICSVFCLQFLLNNFYYYFTRFTTL